MKCFALIEKSFSVAENWGNLKILEPHWLYAIYYLIQSRLESEFTLSSSHLNVINLQNIIYLETIYVENWPITNWKDTFLIKHVGT